MGVKHIPATIKLFEIKILAQIYTVPNYIYKLILPFMESALTFKEIAWVSFYVPLWYCILTLIMKLVTDIGKQYPGTG